MSDPMQCSNCPIPLDQRVCLHSEGTGPSFCPTLKQPWMIDHTLKRYQEPEIRTFAREAARQEADAYWNRVDGTYPIKPRLRETIEFAKRMGYRRLGIAFCAGLHREAGLLSNVLEAHEFEAVSAVCKVGGIPKETIGLTDDDKIKRGADETLCNPIGQAALLNFLETEFNIVLGLCVGHDAHFFAHSNAPVTVLAAKDRVMGHNPIAALYTIESYSRWIKHHDPEPKTI